MSKLQLTWQQHGWSTAAYRVCIHASTSGPWLLHVQSHSICVNVTADIVPCSNCVGKAEQLLLCQWPAGHSALTALFGMLCRCRYFELWRGALATPAEGRQYAELLPNATGVA
jgi:hypothetical protein